MNKVYTIGHSSYKQDYLFILLNKYDINCVVDVRSMPFSKYAPQYNRDEIKRFLHSKGIQYIFMGKELGARREDNTLYESDGILSFEKTSKTMSFISGIERIKAGIEKGYRIAIMCTEKDPMDCHRNILVARQLYKQKYEVLNILENGYTESQEHLEKRLLDLYFPTRNQRTLFDLASMEYDDSALIEKAYDMRNKDIGFNINNEKEKIAVEDIYHRVY